MDKQLAKAIIQTLVYADIFDYPLTKEEIWRFLITDGSLPKVNKEIFFKALETLIPRKDAQVVRYKEWFYLKGRAEIITVRVRRRRESQRKMTIARSVARFVSLVPAVQLIGVSGALAVENAKVTDDIDLFIISKKGTLWLTRLLILGILQILGKRRRWGEKQVENKVCVNMIMDESSLSLPKKRHDLYTAHEIAQLKVLFERDTIYQRFLKANSWGRKFLPNAFFEVMDTRLPQERYEKKHTYLFIEVLEKIVKKIQCWQIRKHQTREIVSDTLLAFHPLDYKKNTLARYRENLVRYRFLLDAR